MGYYSHDKQDWIEGKGFGDWKSGPEQDVWFDNTLQVLGQDGSFAQGLYRVLMGIINEWDLDQIESIPVDEQFVQTNGGLYVVTATINSAGKTAKFLLVHQMFSKGAVMWFPDSPAMTGWNVAPFDADFMRSIFGPDSSGEMNTVEYVIGWHSMNPMLNWLHPKTLEKLLEER